MYAVFWYIELMKFKNTDHVFNNHPLDIIALISPNSRPPTKLRHSKITYQVETVKDHLPSWDPCRTSGRLEQCFLPSAWRWDVCDPPRWPTQGMSLRRCARYHGHRASLWPYQRPTVEVTQACQTGSDPTNETKWVKYYWFTILPIIRYHRFWILWYYEWDF